MPSEDSIGVIIIVGAFLVGILALGILVYDLNPLSSSVSDEKLEETMGNLLLPEGEYYEVTIKSKTGSEEVHELRGGPARLPENTFEGVPEFKFSATYTHLINQTEMEDRRYTTEVTDGGLRLNIEGVGNETVSGVTGEGLGRVFNVDIGDRSEWRFVSYEDELRAILDETEGIKGSPPGDVVISLDTNESEVAGYFNRLQEAPAGKPFANISAADIQNYEATFSFTARDNGGIDPTGSVGDNSNHAAVLRISAETERWDIESRMVRETEDR